MPSLTLEQFNESIATHFEGNRAAFARYIDVGQSTISGWVKAETFPLYVSRIFAALDELANLAAAPESTPVQSRTVTITITL